MFLAGFICGVCFLGIVCVAFAAGKREPKQVAVDEDFEWNHPELAHLMAGKAPIYRLPPGGETLH